MPGGAPHVGNWTPRWKRNEQAIGRIGRLLCESDRDKRHGRFDELQAWLTGFCSSIPIAEGRQVMAANRHVPPSLISPDARFYQALNHQNCTTNYLPEG